MKNFKDTVYSIFLNEERERAPENFTQKEWELAPKGKTQQEWDKELDKYDEDMRRIDREAQAKTPQGIKDAADQATAATKKIQQTQQEIENTKVTSGGVQRSLTVGEAQKAADAAGVPNPHGDSSRQDDSIRDADGNIVGLSPKMQARFNQSQQNRGPYEAISRAQYIDAEHKGMLFNHMTGTWHQGPPRIGGGASTGNRGNSGHYSGTEGPPPDLRTEAEKEAGAQRAAKLRGDIIREAEALKARQATPEGRRKLDTESRGKIGLGARGQEDWDAMEAVRDKGIAQAKRNKDFKESNAGKAAEHARSEGVRSHSSKDRRQAQEDYRLAQVAWEDAAAAATPAAAPAATPAATPASAPAAAPNPNASNGSSDDPTGAASDPQGGPGEPDRRAGTLGVPTEEPGSTPGSGTGAGAGAGSTPGSGTGAGAGAGSTPGSTPGLSGGGNPDATVIPDSYSYNKALTFFAEQLKRKYIEEEVVNPENQPMSKSEISHRDRIRHKSPAKDARIVKSGDKTQTNAAYRLATYITMRARKGKKKENK